MSNGKWLFPTVATLAGIALTSAMVSCGGGGGGGTTISGNMSGSQAFLPGPPRETRLAWTDRLSLVAVAWAQAPGVEVCLSGSDVICDVTDETGAFTLPVDGDLAAPVCLDFTGSSFSASFCLPFAIPNGSRVRISNIECDVGGDSCSAEDIDVDEPGDPSEPSDVSDEDFPSEPSEPSEPSGPSSPDDPSEPSFPDDPSEPSQG